MQFPWSKPKIPVISLRGIIAARPGAISLDAYTAPIERGFALAKRSKHLLLAIESPGGSAAQSDLIGQFLRRRAAETGVEITAVIGDVGASGGYWLACAASKIYANRLSIVGSIGVITGGFGLDKFIARHDIERRLFTAGDNKARMEMFSPLRPQDEAFTRELLAEAHEMFKSWVRERRGARLTPDEKQNFRRRLYERRTRPLARPHRRPRGYRHAGQTTGRRKSQTRLAAPQTTARHHALHHTECRGIRHRYRGRTVVGACLAVGK